MLEYSFLQVHLLQSADAEQGNNKHGEPVSPQLPGSKAHSHSAAFPFVHTHTAGAGGEIQSPANRLLVRQDKGKQETDEECRVASCMCLLTVVSMLDTP